MKKENFVPESLPKKDQQELRNLFQALSDKEGYMPPTWSELEIKQGDIIAASSGGDNDKVVLFPSTGDENWDLEIAQRNGLETPQFGYAESWFRSFYNDGLMILRDRKAGIEPPPGDTRELKMGIDY